MTEESEMGWYLNGIFLKSKKSLKSMICYRIPVISC